MRERMPDIEISGSLEFRLVKQERFDPDQDETRQDD
jgi:hypothetical protein